MKKTFLAQLFLVFLMALSGFSNDVSGQSCTQSGGTGYFIGEFCTTRTWNLQIPNGGNTKVLDGTGSPVTIASILGYAPLASEVDGSVTNEIELPSQTGQSGKYLTTNGTATSWVTPGAATITLTGDVTGSGTSGITTTLSNTGVTAGTYGLLTVDAKGRVTGGKRQETYSGTTDGSGNYAVTFGTSYPVAPNIQANPIGGSTELFLKIVSVSTTGFTVNVFQRATVLSLALSTATTAVSGQAVDVLITQK